MRIYPFSPVGQRLQTDVKSVACDRAFVAHFQVPATLAVASSAVGVHAAFACTTPQVAAVAVVAAATAVTDILTTTLPLATGATGNDLSILLTTSASDALAVTKDDETATINIALAKTTAASNTATLIQAAIRGLTTVGGVSVALAVCVAGGNWNTAAVATGEIAAVLFAGGQTAANDVLITGITSPTYPRNVTASTDGTAGDVKAVQVIITGTNYDDDVITETLPIFTVNQKTTVVGSKAFKTVTSVTIPSHDDVGATTSIGWGVKLGFPYKLTHNTVLNAYLGNAIEAVAPTIAVSSTAIESNTITLATALNGSIVDAYLLV